MSHCDEENLKQLKSPVRNRYFYGKQMGVAQFQREQLYHRQQRALLSRLCVGKVVLCGLEVTVTENGKLEVQPGVAIDGLGRLIVVPEVQLVTVPKNWIGMSEILAKLWLCYKECGTKPAPAPGNDPCHPNASMEYDATQEWFELKLESYSTASKTIPDIASNQSCAVAEECCVELVSIKVEANIVVVNPDVPASPRFVNNMALLEMIDVMQNRIDHLQSQIQGGPGKPGGRPDFGGIVGDMGWQRPDGSGRFPLRDPDNQIVISREDNWMWLDLKRPITADELDSVLRVWQIKQPGKRRSRLDLKDLKLEQQGTKAVFRFDSKSKARVGTYEIEIVSPDASEPIKRIPFSVKGESS
jgi:hypothetical protein